MSYCDKYDFTSLTLKQSSKKKLHEMLSSLKLEIRQSYSVSDLIDDFYKLYKVNEFKFANIIRKLRTEGKDD